MRQAAVLVAERMPDREPGAFSAEVGTGSTQKMRPNQGI